VLYPFLPLLLGLLLPIFDSLDGLFDFLLVVFNPNTFCLVEYIVPEDFVLDFGGLVYVAWKSGGKSGISLNPKLFKY
jgi:hypothetical protein